VTTELAKENISSGYELAVARAAKIMSDYPGITEVGLIRSKNRISITFNLAVDLPSKAKVAGITKSGVKALEPISIEFPQEYPELSPIVFLRKDFPENTPHFTPGKGELCPRPCLVQEAMDEYHMAAGLPGVLNQLVIWMHKAAKRKLVDRSSGWEPTYRIASDYRIFLDSKALVALADQSGGAHILEAPYFEKEEESVSRYSDIPSIDGSYAFEANRDKMQNDSFMRSQGFNGSLGGAYWVAHKGTDETGLVSQHFPENISDHVALQNRIVEMGAGIKDCIYVLLQTVSEIMAGAEYRAWRTVGTFVPIPVFLLVRRPFNIIGSESNIEILSYIIEYPFGCDPVPLVTGTRLATVRTARTFPLFSRDLLSRMDDYEGTASISLIGAGSVGSKIGISLSRSGWDVKAICDKALMLPHNYARHSAQIHTKSRVPKVNLLANTIQELGGDPLISTANAIDIANVCVTEGANLGWGADYIINSTASNRVRLALSRVPFEQQAATLVDAGLLKQGNVARLLIEGPQKNPNFYDLEALFYQKATKSGLARRLETGEPDLVPVDIGLGCGSVTMKMTDSRLSSMTALMTEEIMEFQARHGRTPDNRPGLIAVWEKDDHTGNTGSTRIHTDPFAVVPIEESDWTVRIAPNVINTIERDRLKFPDVETGGVMIGRYNEVNKTVTIVDTIEAPPDSTRSAHLFSLGTDGTTEEIRKYFQSSGHSLMDMGTWHTHLADSPPSSRDQMTAIELMGEDRAHPFVLLIHSPSKMYAVWADPIDNKKEAA